MKRIGILTSGGDCQGLNAAIRAVAKTLYNYYGTDGVEIIGIIDGYRGLIYGEHRKMSPENFSGILTMGGTILGTSRQPFKLMRVVDENNDLWATDKTFGFQSAVDIATNVIDCIHTTATSHGRVFIVEVMGHKVGWLTLYAGIAGGADIILIPEIPYDIKSVIKTINARTESGKNFSILAVAEGAISKELAVLPKKQKKAAISEMAYPSISYKIAKEIEDATGRETRVTVPGHFQRGGSPDAYDRVLSTRFGVAAAQLVIEKDYGKMVALVNNRVAAVPLEEIAGKLKTVPIDSEVVETARKIGISFGE